MMPNQPVLTPTDTLAYLQRARMLLEKPSDKGLEGHSWIKYAEAIDRDGRHVQPESEQADAWCFIGVLKAVTKYAPDPSAAYRYCYSIVNLANPKLVAQGGSGLAGAAPQINDSAYSFETVRKLFLNAETWLLRHGA